MPFTYYVSTKDAKVYQVNNVTAITIASPLVSNGTYRDQNAVVVGGAAAALGADAAASVVGGTSQTITTVGSEVQIVANSSVEQDDTFQHVAPRFLNAPIAMVFFTTTAGISTAPTNATFTTTPPSTDFYVVDADCFFTLDEVIGVYNAPPQGWTPSRSIVTAYNES